MGVDQLYHCSVQPGYLKILQMGDTDPRHKIRKTEYEVKPQYEELSKQLNMQHAINQCYECMKAIKNRIARPVYQLANQIKPPYHSQPISRSQKGYVRTHDQHPASSWLCNSRQTLPASSNLKVHASKRKTQHRFLPKTMNARNSTLPGPTLTQGLKWIAIERAKLGEFSATKTTQFVDGKRWESTKKCWVKTGHPVATLKTQRFYLSKRRRTAYVTLAVARYLATGSSNHRIVTPSNVTAEISSQHSKMLTNTCHSFVDPCISAPAASSNHSKPNYCQQITMRNAYVISTDSKFTSLELQ
ncbi:hypothetical protein F511_13012 [Dorcoceras hygrometricum]|uniref:Uncharacterized protein n=1 Tax=Dorcoceras hygrometricum TaxID=472368 RepID=A0A2Z7AUQ2_9LAMI|nr:hypothetical protein F511_13012 [Dorcoceras hygrometricum]